MTRDLAKLRAWQRRSSPLKRSPMRKRSAKQARRDREWSALKAQAIAERGDVCEPCKTNPDSRCSGRADDAHHMAGRLVQRLDVLLLVGRWHHDWIGRNPLKSFARGWSLPRNQQPLMKDTAGPFPSET